MSLCGAERHPTSQLDPAHSSRSLIVMVACVGLVCSLKDGYYDVKYRSLSFGLYPRVPDQAAPTPAPRQQRAPIPVVPPPTMLGPTVPVKESCRQLRARWHDAARHGFQGPVFYQRLSPLVWILARGSHPPGSFRSVRHPVITCRVGGLGPTLVSRTLARPTSPTGSKIAKETVPDAAATALVTSNATQSLAMPTGPLPRAVPSVGALFQLTVDSDHDAEAKAKAWRVV